jgi:hypothetical protein
MFVLFVFSVLFFLYLRRTWRNNSEKGRVYEKESYHSSENKRGMKSGRKAEGE